jgi:hypothetical protein
MVLLFFTSNYWAHAPGKLFVAGIFAFPSRFHFRFSDSERLEKGFPNYYVIMADFSSPKPFNFDYEVPFLV